MPTRPNSETKLISALINTGDVEAAALFGITPEMFASHGAEYRWLIAFPDRYGCQPNSESLMTKFKDFPYSEASVDVGFLSDDVKDANTKRAMVSAMQGIASALRNDDTEEAFAFFASIQHPANLPSRRLRNSLHDEGFLDSYEDKIERFSVPWRTLQRATGGMAPGDFGVFAARLKQGKSWTLLDQARHSLLEGRKVTIFSLEMPAQQVLTRMHVMLARELGITVTHNELHHKTYPIHAYRSLLGRIKEEIPGELFIVDTSNGQITTATVASMGVNTDIVIVDHLGLMSTHHGRRAIEDWREMATISNTMKEIAQVNKVPILAAAQINREGDTKGWKPPKTKNLSQSDAIGQDADWVVTMKRRSKNVAVYSIEDNRHGDSGDLFHTRFMPNEGRFEEISFEKAAEQVERDIEKQEGM